ncbi:MAG: ABC transporter substrate-binding protein [Chloroflexota bacterium]
MQPTKTSKLWILVGIIVLLFLVPSISAQDQPILRIGVLDNERGAVSNGARLAVREINGAGGIRLPDGNIALLDLVIEPSGSGLSLEDAVQALNEAGVIAVLGPQTSDEVLNGLASLQSLNVPVITPATDDTIITSDASDLLFRSRAAEALQGQALASYLISEFNLTPIATIQLDIASSASVVDFTTSASTLGVTPDPALLLTDPNNLGAQVTTLVEANPAVIVAYGDPVLTATLYSSLRAQGWEGLFAYNQAFDPLFRNTVPFDQLSGVVAVTTWPFTARDENSVRFLQAFIYAYGELPGPVEAASYDSVKLLADALLLPGSLRDNFAGASETQGVQGILNANELGEGEISNNVAVVRLGELGAPEVLARYEGNELLPAVLPTPVPGEVATSVPLVTAVPQGVSLTITQVRQNVRSGPGDIYSIVGQMNQGETASIIGTSADNTWVVINFRGQQGWLAAYLLQVTGDLRNVPIIPTPPTPTVGVTPTASPAPFADLIIVSASISPNPIVPNQNFTVTVTVGNIGGTPAGQFIVSGTFPPSNVLLSATVPGLAPGQSAVVNMSGVLSGSGGYTTSLQMDSANQVNEGTVGEQNNLYDLSYNLGVSIMNQNSGTLDLGATIDLEGNAAQGDANWNNDGGVLGLKAIFGAKLGIIGTGDFNAVTYEQVNPATINRDAIPSTELAVGTLVGIITADGHRGVMQVTAISDTQISLNYKVWNG